MKNIIKIHAVVDGNLKQISDLNDEVFSKKMLGDGFFIKPLSSAINSPMNNSKIVDIFETKHAFITEGINGVSILTHIGIDTVKLGGEPYKYNVKNGDTVNVKSNIVDVDFKSFNKMYDDSVCVSFINQSEYVNSKFTILKTGDVKAGDLVAEISIEDTKSLFDDKNLSILNFSSRFEIIAKTTYSGVGTENNYSSFTNCITRLRFQIIDKNKVDMESLKKMDGIQGVIWSGDELQIVIGADVVKARDAYDFYVLNKDKMNDLEVFVKKDKKNLSFMTKSIKSISGVITDLIPFLIASGMLYAVWNILMFVGLVQGPPENGQLTDNNVLSGVLYIICTSGMTFLGFAFGIATTKYMGGNIVLGSLLALILLAPQLYGGQIWELFELAGTLFIVQGYTNLIIPQVIGAVIFVLFDRFFRKVMPSMVDILLRPFLSLLLTLLIVFFFVGPTMGILEGIFTVIVAWVDNMPFGLSLAIFATMTIPLTVIGIAWVVSAPMMAQLSAGVPSAMMAGWVIGEFGQAGATFAVAIKTKNSNLKRIALTGGITGIFGVSEPLLYSVNLPKGKPFIAGLIGTFVSGLITGALGLKIYTIGAGGIFYFTGFVAGGWEPLLLATLAIALSFILSFVLCWFMYSEIKDPKKAVNKLNVNAYKLNLISNNKKFHKKDEIDLRIKELMLDIEDEFNSDYKETYKIYEKLISKKVTFESNLSILRDKEEKYKTSLVNKARKLDSTDPKLIEFNNKFISTKFSKKITQVNSELKLCIENVERESKIINQVNDKITIKINNYLSHLDNNKKNSDIKFINFKNDYFNAMHGVEIIYDQEDIRESEIFKKDIKNLKKEYNKQQLLNK